MSVGSIYFLFRFVLFCFVLDAILFLFGRSSAIVLNLVVSIGNNIEEVQYCYMVFVL